MARQVLAVVVGVAVAVGALLVLGRVVHTFYPLPPGVDLHDDTTATAAWIDSLPAGAFLALLHSFGFAAMMGGVAATAVGRTSRIPALVVGALLTVLCAVHVVSDLWPRWFAVGVLMLFVPGAWLGWLSARRLAKVK